MEEEVAVEEEEEEGDHKISRLHFNSNVIICSRNSVVYSKIQLHFSNRNIKCLRWKYTTYRFQEKCTVI